MKTKILEHIVVGLGIGFVVATACLWIFGVYEATGMEVMRQYTVWLVASALYGLVSMIYDSSISFPYSLIIHFVVCAAVTFAAVFASGIMVGYTGSWYAVILAVLPVFVVIYIVVGAAVTLACRCEAKKINEKISLKNK